MSCPDAIGRLIEKVANLQNGKNENNVSVEEISKGSENLEIGSKTGGCPECGMALEHEGGCVVCRSCGYSKCG